MRLIVTSIPDVLLIEPKVYRDERGFFLETYHSQRFQEAGIPSSFVQDNHSGSNSLTLRGLHYQIRKTQGKLVRAIAGEIFDIAVDLRRSSPTFGQWTGEILSAQNMRQLWIPPGFAHGFLVLSDWAEVAYKATDFYAPEHERSLLWNDPAIGIRWPIPTGASPVISAKDALGKHLHEAEIFE
jgi:dTDP-4-dehydrorhamnose 3,5-epimerase